MSIFGDIERFLSEDLYPYRYPITIGLIMLTAAAAAFAYRKGWQRVAWQHKTISAVAAAILVPAAVVGSNYFLSPLWERSTVCEASPIAGAGTGSQKCEGMSAVAATFAPTPSATKARDVVPHETPSH